MSGPRRSVTKCILPSGDGYGWGICGGKVSSVLESRGLVEIVRDYPKVGYVEDEGSVLQAIASVQFNPFSGVVADLDHSNIGFGFIEDNLLAAKFAPMGRRFWDVVVCGSSWMSKWIRDLGFDTEVILQGVDPSVFHLTAPPEDDLFTVGSFGKFEYRKSQDVVVKAFSILRSRHKDVRLMALWGNQWLKQSTHLFQAKDWLFDGGNYSLDDIKNALHRSGIGPSFGDDIVMDGNVMNHLVPKIMSKCDVAIFPARCEAGQALPFQEATAMGVPSIVPVATGFTDYTDRIDYPMGDLLLRGGKVYTHSSSGVDLGEWTKPCLDEVVSQLEYAYQMRDKLRSDRKKIADFGGQFTWDATADRFEAVLNAWS
jgi:glycosyltransferase involved in cell wall biosynthesis